jgi:hypothetical protein
MLVRLLTALLVLLPGARACTVEFEDPIGDVVPDGIPGYYDIVAINLTLDHQNLTWTWVVDSIEGVRNIHFHGQLFLGDYSRENSSFHPGCDFETITVDDERARCHLTRIDASPTGVGSGFFVQWLNYTVGDDRLSVSISREALGIANNTALSHLWAETQIAIGSAIPGYGVYQYPRRTDETTNWDWEPCGSERPAPSTPAVGPVPSKDSPALSLLATVMILPMAVWHARRKAR